MNPRRESQRSVHGASRPIFKLGIVSFIISAGIVISSGIYLNKPVQAPGHTYETPAPVRELLDFHMNDLSNGWAKYNDVIMSTENGGLSWREDSAALDSSTSEDLNLLLTQSRSISSITIQSKSYLVKKGQFLTDRIGWVQLTNTGDLNASLWVTGDGGITWHDRVTPEIQRVMENESQQLKQMKLETVYYAGKDTALKAMRSGWTLFPDTASPGDVVLVRRQEPGNVTWQGKVYELKPFGAGYFTYVPIAIDVKPGSYPIGDQTLTITAKKFEIQQLQVSKQLESMKQDTARIQADQKKIDLARSSSQPEFLFTGPFLQPVEGRLTTPYGFTRYVNGKYDSSHRAIDLAAKEGTPIKATNDGIVVLAEALYLTGNAIYIDHGMGLFSQYAHLHELNVKTGDRVKQGDIIGTVGSTGFSTGPHLHFAFWAHNVPVNPNLFFNKTPFQWLTQDS